MSSDLRLCYKFSPIWKKEKIDRSTLAIVCPHADTHTCMDGTPYGIHAAGSGARATCAQESA